MKTAVPSSLASLPEPDRILALHRFQILRPFLENGVPLTEVAKHQALPLRTLWHWVKQYRHGGMVALSRKVRIDSKTERCISPSLEEVIQGLALQKPRRSVATIYRNLVAFTHSKGEPPPSYHSVYRVIRKLDPALLTLAHEGTKVYSEAFDLIHRREAEAPNAMWQADHTELDIWITSENGKPRKPWLTIVLDDYSRAVAGYFLFINAPTAIQTALALRQAIWRKETPGWHVCGIPQILYTDHGSDFTSRHIEHVAADLKVQLVFSGAGRPRGRGKIERFFETLSQVFLPRLPGFCPAGSNVRNAELKLSDLAKELEAFVVNEYHLTPHSTTKEPPQARWESGGFLPQMPESLEQLDLLLLTVPKARTVLRDGIHFLGFRYIDPTLAAYVGEKVILRYDPRDVAEVRVFFQDRFLCRAVCQELAGETVALREILQARNRRRRDLRLTIEERRSMVDSLLEARRWTAPEETKQSTPLEPLPETTKLKRYFNE